MSLIAIKDLSLIRTETLFAGLDLSIAKGDRLGLVAANGRGKSSLLRILASEEEATGGTLTRSRGLVAAFAPQDPPTRLLAMSLYDAVRDALDAEAAETESWRVDVLLDDLAVDEALRSRPVGSLSGGWQRSMLLARAAVIEPDLLLLDEPTNHLDLARIGVLERFLAGLPRDCAVVVASHDRAFLDDISSRTLFLRPTESADFALPYSRALQALEERDHAMMMVKFLLDTDAEVRIPGVEAPETGFADVVAPVELALAQERRVSEQIFGLTKTAREENDFAAEQFMQWFIKEQVEEVSTMNDLLTVVTRAQHDLEAIEEYVKREQGGEGADPTAPPIAGA